MPRKVFISFLGITKYFKARYYFETEGTASAPEPECFVQISLMKLLKDTFTANDKAYIFLTNIAEEKNWNDKANFEEGLNTRLQHLQKNSTMKCAFEPVHNIPEGFTSEEIWELFQTVLKKIEPNDEVYLDITHAFRHIPMLAMTIMNFALAVKQIRLKAIYYGAFEKILNDYEKRTSEKIFASQVEQKIIEEDRYAPILNLSTLEQLQQWSFAARSFHETGNTFFLAKLTRDETKPLLAATEGKHTEADNLSRVSSNLTTVTDNLTTCRGKKIEARVAVDFTVEKIKAMQADGTFVKPFEELLDCVLDKLSQLDAKHYPPWFNAVKWCQQHRFIQQGITLLQEGIITHVIQQFNNPSKLDWGIREDREIVGAAFYILSHKAPKEKWNDKARENEEIIHRILRLDKIAVLSKIYDAISEKRNYINHGGFLTKDNTEPFQFEQALKKCITDLEEKYFN